MFRKESTYKPLLDTRKKAAALAVALGASAVLALLYFLTVESKISAVLPDCMLRTAVGLRCVMCGGTRCMREIIACDFVKAFYYNPYVVLCGLSAVLWYIRLVFGVFRKEYKPVRMSEGYLWALLISALVFTAVRNFDFYKSIFY